MKRSVIQLAKKTNLVSLPIIWVKKYNINKGDQLEVIENGGELIIKSNSSSEPKSIKLDIIDFNERTLKYSLSSLHKLGYDEIILSNISKNQLVVIEELLRDLLLGFVITDQKDKKVILKSIMQDLEDKFDPTLRRAFLVTISMSNSMIELINLNKCSELISLINLEKTNNQLTSFCIRLINKGFYKKNNSNFIINIIWNLEKIADEYKYICYNLSKNDTLINEDIINIFKKVNGFLNGYYELFYSFNIYKLNSLIDEREEILNMVDKLNSLDNVNIKLLSNLMAIKSKLYDLSSSIFALNHIKE